MCVYCVCCYDLIDLKVIDVYRLLSKSLDKLDEIEKFI